MQQGAVGLCCPLSQLVWNKFRQNSDHESLAYAIIVATKSFITMCETNRHQLY